MLNAEDVWEPARNPLNRYSTVKRDVPVEMNPGYMFAKTMLERDSTAVLGLIVNARGATSIEEWAKGSMLYNEAVRRTRIAAKSGKLAGVLWHQGEDNANDRGYLEKLSNLIFDLRADLDAPGLPFVAGQILAVNPVNGLIARLPETVPGTGFVSSAGLTGDIHFDRRSMLVLGRRYAEVMLQVEASKRKR